MSGVTSITDACEELERVLSAELERKADEREYRTVRWAIDDACERVERVNLAGGGPCPSEVGALIEYLQLLAGEPVVRPVTSLQAHSVLFRLASLLLGWPLDDDHERPRVRRGRAA